MVFAVAISKVNRSKFKKEKVRGLEYIEYTECIKTQMSEVENCIEVPSTA